MRIDILVGSMTGNAQFVAEELQLGFSSPALDITLINMEGLRAADLRSDRTYLICSSTYGQGDVPDNAWEFYESLKTERPDLSGLRYGVIGLGDRTYQDTYNLGSQRLDELLSALGAQRIGERALLDASAGDPPEPIAMAWMSEWLARLAGKSE